MSSPFPILLIEDDEVDVEAFRRAWRRMELNNPVHIVGDGIEALEWLRDYGAERGCLIILDLNLPGIDGLEVLRQLRADSRLARNPVFVLTTSARASDLAEAYSRKVYGYFLKEDFDVFTTMIGHYCRISQIP